MSRYINDAYLIVMLAIYSLIQTDVSIVGVDVRTILTIALALVFLATRTVLDNGFRRIKRGRFDIAVYMAGAFALSNMAYKLFWSPNDFEKYITLLSLCILYFAIRNYCQNMGADIVAIASAFNSIVSVALLFHYLVAGVKPAALASGLLESGACLSWLVLAVTINVAGFCVCAGNGLWYGANAIIGFFLLFIQNNAVAAAIVFFMFLQMAVWYVPRKIMVRRIMQMFFAYAFLLCNMCLITNYTKLLKVEGLPYDLESGVYMELALAAFGVCFFHAWDKAADGGNIGDLDKDAVLAQFRGFFKKAHNAALAMLAAVAIAVMRGGTNIPSEMFGKLVSLCRSGMEDQAGIFEPAVSLYGIPGAIMAGGLIFGVACMLAEYRQSKMSRHGKLFCVVSWVFAAQALLLTQSFASLPVYVIFIAVTLNECDRAARLR